MQVLEQGRDGRVIVAHPEKCTACRWCELHCPDFAIFVQDVPPSEDVGKVPLKDETSETEPQEETV
jgi:formate hydrogenlyase subunit 6/NADH:ubiquinone oxidoreductase subunit I